MKKEHAQYLAACKARRTKAFQLRQSGLTLQQVGDIMGISRERVRQMAKREGKA
jgi:DNA-directed RNA polymerase sigma subunit (sigma70/sigma32)